MDTPNSIEQALEMLNQAAQERREELRDLIGERYRPLQEALSGVKEGAGTVSEGVSQMRANITDFACEAAEVIKDRAKKYVKTVDEQAHEKPWIFIGAVAAGAMLLGVMLGTKLGDRK